MGGCCSCWGRHLCIDRNYWHVNRRSLRSLLHRSYPSWYRRSQMRISCTIVFLSLTSMISLHEQWRVSHLLLCWHSWPCVVQEIKGYGWVKIDHIEGDNGVLVFIFDLVKPIQNGGCIFHWLRLKAVMHVLLILSSICLPIFPVSDFLGLIGQQVGLLARFGLYSISMMKPWRRHS